MKTSSVDNVLRMVLAMHKVTWENPVVMSELDSYFGCPETIAAFAKQGIRYSDETSLRAFLSTGKLNPIPDEVLSKVGNLAFTTKEMDAELMDQTYSQAYKEIENKIERGDLLLQAPIVIKFNDGSYWGFSGRKRAYAARRHGAAVLYFIVEQRKDIGDKNDNDGKKKNEQEEG